MTTQIERKIHELDATGIPFGRLASQIATLLIGKRKAAFRGHEDHGDHVNVTNVALMKITGNKLDQKIYRRHTMYPGNMKEAYMKEVLAKDPSEILRHAVIGMLPKNKHRSIYMRRLVIK